MPIRTTSKSKLLVFLASLCLAGCTSLFSSDNNPDPFETFNRQSLALNDALDTYFLKPVAKGYDFITPDPVQDSVGNFFENIYEVSYMGNNLLQANWKGFGTSASRFLINSTIGVLGLFDVATDLGLERHYSDFGLTLAKWGVKESPYLMIPLWGPSTLRDAAGLPVDNIVFSPLIYLPADVRNILWGVDIIETRSQYLPYDALYQQAFDKYTFLRDAYLQRRAKLVKMTDEEIPITSRVTGESGVNIPMRRADSGGTQGIASTNQDSANSSTSQLSSNGSNNVEDIYIDD